MQKKFVLVAALVGAALLSAPAQAGFDFNLGTLLDGAKWRVPSCAAPKVLRETRDGRTGKIVWRCVDAPARTADARR